jgi:hypothetical protein
MGASVGTDRPMDPAPLAPIVGSYNGIVDRGSVVVTKSIDLSEHEADELRELVRASGEIESSALKRAAVRGIREMRLEQGILDYLAHRDSSAAAAIAGIGRAAFLQALIDRGVHLLEGGPSTLAEELEYLGKSFGDDRLVAAAHKLMRVEA